MEILNLQTEIGEGKDTEVNLLFDGARRKIMQITLRQNAVLKAHQAAEPITIQCVAGTGDLINVTQKETCKLSPGVLVTMEPKVIHEIKALPEVSILLTKFKEE
jgi:quercetin dioxygenase-like cupin family protein